jgi:NAD(P)-dependent dehydrogenase (short-subunit alcohol dehydrogenase family)
MTNRLDGKVAVITGAASGIGLATLELFVESGARVVAADVQVDVGRELERKFPNVVRFAACDVTQLPQLKSAIDSSATHFGALDILFSNAGRGGTPATVEEFDAQGWDDTMALLLRSVAAGASYAVPHMKKRGGGSIINTSSVSALQAGYAPLTYSVAKAGVLHYTRVAASQLSAHRIRMNALVPGFIATSIFGAGLGLGVAESKQLADRIATHSGVANPIGRSGLPRDIAEAALFLASDASGFVTGTHLTVDGGITIGPRHSWDAQAQSMMPAAIGISAEQYEAMRAASQK